MRQIINEEIQVFRVRLCRKDTLAIVTWTSRSRNKITMNLFKALVEILVVSAEGEMLYGSALASHCERMIAKMLKRMERIADEESDMSDNEE